MRTWVFQGNPERFDIESYLTASPKRIAWRVARYADEMSVGDQVFIWRSQGAEKENAGIMAEAEIASPVRRMFDDPVARPFWRDPKEASIETNRVWLDIRRVANKRQMLKRDWLKEEPALRGMLILQQAAGTNFPVTRSEQKRGAGLDTCRGRCGPVGLRTNVR